MTIEKAIEWFKNKADDYLEPDKRRAYMMAISAIRAQQKTKWISVKDRLPEDDLPENSNRKMIRCLVTTDRGTVKQCVRKRCEKTLVGDMKIYQWEWNKADFAKPTHWMPMPKPAKRERK